MRVSHNFLCSKQAIMCEIASLYYFPNSRYSNLKFSCVNSQCHNGPKRSRVKIKNLKTSPVRYECLQNVFKTVVVFVLVD